MPPLSFFFFLLLLLLSHHPSSFCHADFGDYAQDASSFTCPALTTCPQVCVLTVDDCALKKELQCPSNAPQLCNDGTCASTVEECNTNTNDNNNNNLPCPHACAPIACPRTHVAGYEDCLDLFADFYLAMEECEAEAKALQATKQYTFREGPFIFCYVWLAGVTLAVLCYCAYNQRWNPVENSTLPLQDTNPKDNNDKKRKDEPTTTTTNYYYQTGYKTTLLGRLLYIWTLWTILGFQLILLILSVQYYINQGGIHSNFEAIFDDEEQLLRAFEITWMIGFVWCFCLKWPKSIESLFWRRCRLQEATHVAILALKKDDHPNNKKSQHHPHKERYIARLSAFTSCLMGAVDRLMAFVFSDVERARHGRRGGFGGGKWTHCKVQTENDNINIISINKYIVFHYRRYTLEGDRFVAGRIDVTEGGGGGGDLRDQLPGLSSEQVLERRRLVGPNIISMRKPSFFTSLLEEFGRPFYTYQNFIMWSWIPLWYFYMAAVQTFVIVVGGVTVAYFHYRGERNLYKLTRVFGHAEALRDGVVRSIPQHELVPGDVVTVLPGLVHCDMVLVQAAAVLVDESALTGEATPVAKTAVMEPSYIIGGNIHSNKKRHEIAAGTTVLESEHGTNLALVQHTGSHTAKGELLREMLNYERHLFKFDVEVIVVVIILFFYAIFAFCMVIYFLQDTVIYGWFYGMYAVGSVLPPLLPTVFTVSVGTSENRLSRKRIACTNSEDILVTGKVKRAFFDKTGTLTKQGLDFISVQCRSTWQDASNAISKDMALGMATCHTLTESIRGDLIGNPVDRVMFAASGAALQSAGRSSDRAMTVTDSTGTTGRILKHFDFDHDRMRQSVVVQVGDQLVVYAKGSGESMREICDPSTLPEDFEDVLQGSAKAGIYQISMGRKIFSTNLSMELSQISRDDVERDLEFVGVVNFKNMMREDTPDVIRELEDGGVRCIMITGDSILTGIRIAKESGIIGNGRRVLLGNKLDDSGKVVWVDNTEKPVPFSLDDMESSTFDLAMSGKAWSSVLTSDPEYAALLAEHVRVFGRCTPFDKVSVVTTFIDQGFVTLMCGDGGNDCGALKTAHVGIALSDAEASMVSPFTSLDKNISSVVEVLREGKGALASALASYKYIILYGQVTTLNQIINAYFQITFTEWCWVFMDGIWTITLGFALPLSRAAKRLAFTRPTSSLLGPQTLSSTLGMLTIHFITTVIALATLFNQDWFQCRRWENEDVSNVLVIGDNYEAQTLFLVTGYQFITSAMALNFGYEWRAAWCRNYIFVFFVAAFTFIHFYITLIPGSLSCLFRVNCANENVVRSVTTGEPFAIQNPWNTTVMPESYRVSLLFIMIANAVVAMSWDYCVVNGIRRKYSAKRRERESQFASNVDWLKVDQALAV